MGITAPVLPINSQTLPGHNQETYQRLQEAVQSIPPHQIWLATCDDLPLQRQLAATLEESIQEQGEITSTQLILDAENPEIVEQVRSWAHQAVAHRPPLLQILGIEQLTYRGSDAQYQFLQSLHSLPPLWKQLGCSLLIWTSRPWLKQIRREIPKLGQQVFEFMGEPTPISDIANRQSYQAAFSPVRRWQFLGKPAPEAPPSPQTEHHTDLATAPKGTAVPAIPGESKPETSENPAEKVAATVVSEDLWQQLHADLSDFEAVGNESVTSSVPLESEGEQYPLSDEDVTALDDFSADASSLANESLRSEVLDESSVSDESSAPEPIAPRQENPPEVAYRQARMVDQDSWSIAYELRDRVQAGDHSPATLEAAIQQYEVLQPHQAGTPQQTEVLNDFGSLYWLWAQQARDLPSYLQRLNHSIELYETAVSPVFPGTDASVLNRIHSNLGSVYSLLAAHQDPVLYLGKAVRAFHRALQYAPVESSPEEYAMLQTHLGTAYWSLAQHTQEANHLHRAIAAYQEALRQSHPQQSPHAYAQLQNNLGIALWSLSRHERPIFLLEQAIEAYHTALAYRTIESDPSGCAATHNNLGTAYWDLGGHHEDRSAEQQQAWQQAITTYEAAIFAVDRMTSGNLSFDLWATHHSVGVVYDQLAITLAPDTTAQHPLLTKATGHYVKALVGWQAAESATLETAFQSLVRNLHLQSRYLGIETQQRSLSQIPAEWLPEIWRKL